MVTGEASGGAGKISDLHLVVPLEVSRLVDGVQTLDDLLRPGGAVLREGRYHHVTLPQLERLRVVQVPLLGVDHGVST